jgi:hypothetical protein
VDNFTTKTDGVSNQPADEMNSLFTENKNAVTTSGQSLAVDDFQQSKAMSIYAAGSDYYTDSGTASGYVLSPVGLKKSPISYFEGMRIRFIPGNNCNATPTVNVNGIGNKNIIRWDGTAIQANDIIEDQETTLSYNGTNFVLTLFGSAQFESLAANSGYQKLPSGIILQWGDSGGNIANNTLLDIDYPIAFTTAVYHTSITWIATGTIGGVTGSFGGATQGLTQIRVVNEIGITASCHWFAIGK